MGLRSPVQWVSGLLFIRFPVQRVSYVECSGCPMLCVVGLLFSGSPMQWVFYVAGLLYSGSPVRLVSCAAGLGAPM